ncbi:MAG: hypothetical protein M0T77_14525, partial [Actinomycetota bacterium]|nr:hypothetical protein [Actinomycetota bacterium]
LNARQALAVQLDTENHGKVPGREPAGAAGNENPANIGVATSGASLTSVRDRQLRSVTAGRTSSM